MEVKLLSPSWEHREQYIQLLKEWKEDLGKKFIRERCGAVPVYKTQYFPRVSGWNGSQRRNSRGRISFSWYGRTEDCWGLSVFDHRSRERVFGLMGTAVMESAHRSAERVMQPR